MGYRESERITEGLRYVAGEFSAHRDEFRRELAPGGDALLDALLSLGYAQRGQRNDDPDRVSLTPAGFRRLEDVEPSTGDED